MAVKKRERFANLGNLNFKFHLNFRASSIKRFVICSILSMIAIVPPAHVDDRGYALSETECLYNDDPRVLPVCHTDWLQLPSLEGNFI
jgi:hypothetical protein